jgi:hypothetical protein
MQKKNGKETSSCASFSEPDMKPANGGGFLKIMNSDCE